jgi:hypothetical protein
MQVINMVDEPNFIPAKIRIYRMNKPAEEHPKVMKSNVLDKGDILPPQYWFPLIHKQIRKAYGAQK